MRKKKEEELTKHSQITKASEKKQEKLEIQHIVGRLLSIKKYEASTFILSESEVLGLCFQARLILMSQPMLLELNPPINVCGDIHGQFPDLKQIFKTIGTPTQGVSYLFLGDYVDRGKQSLQCICLLLAYKIQFPQKMFLLRGNHECSELNKIYGFYDECKRRMTIKVWSTLCDLFKCLPVAAVIGDRIFCVHGGLSPYLDKLQKINQIIRPLEPEKETLLNDLLWADPSKIKGWSKNIDRGTSHCFGQDVIQKFLVKNDFDLLCRSHQVAQDGYEFFAGRKLLTIFSSPNYCGMYDNYGAVLTISANMNCHIRQFQKQCLIRLKITREKTPQIADLKVSCHRNGNGEKEEGDGWRVRRTSLRKGNFLLEVPVNCQLLTKQC